MRIEFCKIGREVTCQGDEAREIIGREEVALDFAKDDLDLIEPTGVFGEPVNEKVIPQALPGDSQSLTVAGVGNSLRSVNRSKFNR